MAIADMATVTRGAATQINDEWEVYVPSLEGRSSAFFCVPAKGSPTLSKRARALLGNPEWVSVRINRSRGLIAFIASDQGEQSFKVGRIGTVALTLLAREMNLAHGHYALHRDGDMLVTDIATDHP